MRYSCFAVIIRKGEEEDEVLMVLNNEKMIEIYGEKDVRRAFGVKTRGWGFPGGATEDGEDPADAVIREVEEETGIRVAVKDDTLFYQTLPQGNHAKVFFFIDCFEGSPCVNQREEIADVAWLPLSVALSEEKEILYNGAPVYRGHRTGLRRLLKLVQQAAH